MILGLTPARGGSKGIPKKNIKVIAGKPLLAWTINDALESELLNEYYVSTEDKEIASVARSYGANVLQRPNELSEDHVLTIDVLRHAVEKLSPEIVVLLNPTSPIRRKGLIDDCIRILIDKDIDTVVTGFECKFAPFGETAERRQDIEGFFSDDGNVYVMKSSLIREGKLCGKNVFHYFTSREENTNLDEPFDFWVAEKILKRSFDNEEV